jgi:uncharacterized protein YndB with AHSA1/START domain
MARNSIHTEAAPAQVFAVLDDACAYPLWVVGARRVRAIDPTWPAVGSRFHHAIGTVAAELHDSTKVLERESPNHLVLEVRFRPTGVARVTMDVRADDDGTTITMEEDAIRGPASRIPRQLVDLVLTARNELALHRLRHEVEQRANEIALG